MWDGFQPPHKSKLNVYMNISEIYVHEIEKYKIIGSDDEWYIANLVESLLSACQPHDAFNAMPLIILHAIDESDSEIFICDLQFILSLARKSRTTETPSSLVIHAPELAQKARMFGEVAYQTLEQLFIWFRITDVI